MFKALYDYLGWPIAQVVLGFLARFNEKLNQQLLGQKSSIQLLRNNYIKKENCFWVHAASLGEYEQVVPLLEHFKKNYPKHSIVLSFFSPSGFELKKHTQLADYVVYLAFDRPRKVQEFIDLVQPDAGFIVKYEFWPNYLKYCKAQNIPLFLISGVIRRHQPFFKWYGKWMQEYLSAFEYFFVQDQTALDLLSEIGYNNAVISGDTRFDRCLTTVKNAEKIEVIENFCTDKTCMILGSVWPEDMKLMHEIITESDDSIKWIIAPHEVNEDWVKKLDRAYLKPTIYYSDYLNNTNMPVADASIFVLDRIGLLARAYRYADLAYVGGAVGNTGLHNILEPAAFGVPILCGVNISKFYEAKDLQRLGGLITLSSIREAKAIIPELWSGNNNLRKMQQVNRQWVQNSAGALEIITNYIDTKFS